MSSNETPKSVLDLVMRAVDKYPDSVNEAVDYAEARVDKLESYAEFAETLVRQCLRTLVHEVRHTRNVRMKRDSGDYLRTYRTPSGSHKAVERVYKSVYDFHVAGTRLGEILGKDLGTLAAEEDNRAKGYIFRSKLLAWCLAQGVPADKKVREVIPERKLAAEFHRLKGEKEVASA